MNDNNYPSLSERLKNRLQNSKYFAISVMVHLVLLILIGSVAVYEATKMMPAMIEEFAVPDFTEIAELNETDEPSEGEGGGDGSFGAPDLSSEPFSLPTEGTLDETILAENVSVAVRMKSGVGMNTQSAGAITGIQGGRGFGAVSGVGRGLGRGSGFGVGIGNLVGNKGWGVAGRGKNLTTLNTFYTYFVIHSGDWYAALDWNKNPAREEEQNPAFLPDPMVRWLDEPPPPMGIRDELQGPFVAFGWGVRHSINSRDRRKVESRFWRGNTEQFTKGAMANLMSFARLASKGNIKADTGARAVVLDRDMVPYTFNKVTGEMRWNPVRRELFRESLSQGLPRGDGYHSRGFRWNPKPADPNNHDFTIEYLLDVDPLPPFIYFTGNDDFELNEKEVLTLYEYIKRGGAIWADSGFAGHRSKFDVAFRREMKRVIVDEDKDFRELAPGNTQFLRGEDAFFDLPMTPPGMQYYNSPIQVMETFPGIYSIVLTKNGYGNLLRFELSLVNNAFQLGGDRGRGRWATYMNRFSNEIFRGVNEENVKNAYFLGTNILVYMLHRWLTVLDKVENWNR